MAGDDHAKRIGERIRRLRRERGLTQAGLAHRMCGPVSQTHVSRWERGVWIPERRYREELGRVLGVPAESFLLDDDPPPRPPGRRRGPAERLTTRDTE